MKYLFALLFSGILAACGGGGTGSGPSADTTAPTVAISDNVQDAANGEITFLFTFSESVSGFDQSKVTVTEGTIKPDSFIAVNDSNYKLVVIPPSASYGTLTLTINTEGVMDGAKNILTRPESYTQTYDTRSPDTQAPTVMITDDVSGTANAAVTFTFTFSEGVTGFTTNNITVVNGSKGSFTPVSSSVYTLVVTPPANATGSITLTTGTADVKDAAGNVATAPANYTQAYNTTTADTTAPTVVISDDVSGTASAAVTFTFTFSEGVTGFTTNNITVVNGSKGSFTPVSSSVYTLVVTPPANATGSITLTTGTAGVKDAAGNVATAPANYTQAYNTQTGDAPEPTTVAGSVSAIQTGRVYVGYFPSWSDTWFSATKWDGSALTDDEVLNVSKMSRIPGTYTHVIVAFARPNFAWDTTTNYTNNAWAGTGLDFTAGPKDVKRSIEVLHKRGMKVLLAVGGATYNSWAALSAENGSATGTITKALAQIMVDVGFDGLDVDYEVDGTNTAEYRGAVNAMRKAVDLAKAATGRTDLMLSVAGWSTGADCTNATGTSAACSNTTSYWGGKAGGERLLFFSDATMAAKIDMVNIMSYDARFEHYDGVQAYKLYRGLFPSTTIVNIGLETAPEGWAGGMLVVKNADAQCTGSVILQDQFGNNVNLPYSVERYAAAPKNNTLNANPRDGAMLWQVLKTATASCGSATVASPNTIAKQISSQYGLPADPRINWQ